jgi:aquaporin Z
MAKRASRTPATARKDFIDQKFIAELVGTLALVLVGCGAIAIGGGGTALQIGLAFGLTITAMAYSVGPLSGGHFNPAVTVAMWAAGRTTGWEVLRYVIAQAVGAIIGAGILVAILKGRVADFNVIGSNLGQNGFGPGVLGGYGPFAAMFTEIVATLIFTLVILGVTGRRGTPAFAGLIIGLTLALLHLPFMNVTGLSVNPARSLGPAVYAQGAALTQLWVFIVMPAIGGALAGWLVKSKVIDI